jgi:5-methyltetrahydrofolate--homocysteine methyltransferase
MEELLSKLKASVIEGDEEAVKSLVAEGLAADMEPRELLEGAMMPAMEEIGSRFSSGEAYIPELIVAAYAMEAGMAALKPKMAGGDEGAGTVVLGTVAGDIHSIGKNLVRMCLEGAGFDVVDIGEDLKTEKFVEAYREHSPRILGLSALLSSTMLHMRDVIEAVRAVDPDAVVMVGGAPVTKEYADQIGANGYAPNAFEAVRTARDLL